MCIIFKLNLGNSVSKLNLLNQGEASVELISRHLIDL
jgi:hypothetical protein